MIITVSRKAVWWPPSLFRCGPVRLRRYVSLYISSLRWDNIPYLVPEMKTPYSSNFCAFTYIREGFHFKLQPCVTFLILCGRAGKYLVEMRTPRLMDASLVMSVHNNLAFKVSEEKFGIRDEHKDWYKYYIDKTFLSFFLFTYFIYVSFLPREMFKIFFPSILH